MGSGRFCTRWVVRAGFRLFVAVSASCVPLACFRGKLRRGLLLGAEFLKNLLNRVVFQRTTVGGDGNAQSLQLRNEIAVFHPELFGQFIDTHRDSTPAPIDRPLSF